MTPQESFSQLDAAARRQVHLSLCDDALTVWLAYVRQKPTTLRYRDSVTGTRQRVDIDLPTDALQAARAGADLTDVTDRYLEPITALQDADLTFPEQIEFAYYAIYNCFRKHATGQTINDWLIINQALSAHTHSEAASRLKRATTAIAPAATRDT